jgi:hypothetical protein
MVERYDGDGIDDMPGLTIPIRYWSAWNEPDLRTAWDGPPYPAHQFNGSLQDYIRLSQVTYAAIKDADPAALVVGPTTAQQPGNTYKGEWFLWNWDEFVEAGGLNYVDIVNFHMFFNLHDWDDTGRLDYIMNQASIKTGSKPVWITEMGWDGAPDLHHTEKAGNLVRASVIMWSWPFLDRYFWYTFHSSETHGGPYHKGFVHTLNGVASRGVEPDPLVHPIHRATEVMTTMLASFNAQHRPRALTDAGNPARAYHFSRDG